MAVKTTLNLDETEYSEARRLADATGMTVGEYVNRALRDARLRSWHRRPGRVERAELTESLAEPEEQEREPRR